MAGLVVALDVVYILALEGVEEAAAAAVEALVVPPSWAPPSWVVGVSLPLVAVVVAAAADKDNRTMEVADIRSHSPDGRVDTLAEAAEVVASRMVKECQTWMAFVVVLVARVQTNNRR